MPVEIPVLPLLKLGPRRAQFTLSAVAERGFLLSAMPSKKSPAGTGPDGSEKLNAIRLDAWKQGMTDAAEVVRTHPCYAGEFWLPESIEKKRDNDQAHA